MCAQHQKCAYNLCETRTELANSSVERTFSTKDKIRGKIGVSNGMKPRTQILDKTEKRSESEQVEWASTRFIQACVAQAHEWGGTSRVQQPYKQQKGWPF